MHIERTLREDLADIADDTRPATGLAAMAMRRARRRRYATRTVVAGAAAAVTIPVAMSVLQDPGSTSVPVASGLATSPATELDAAPAPPAHELDDDELAAAFETCQRGVDGEGEPADEGWEPVFGLTVDVDADAVEPTTWVVAQRDDDYRADCALDSSGAVVSGGFDADYGVKSTPDLLYALVDGQESSSGGRYVEPVAAVTIQTEGGDEHQAVLRDGFWFFPIDETRYSWQNHDDDATHEEVEHGDRAAAGENDLIGVPAGYTIRGYDSNGQLLYDSTTDGPSIDNCYADPTGLEIIGNGADHDDPADCVVSHQWQPIH